MRKTGIATFSLDTGRCPRWLFERMQKLGGLMSELIVEEFGPSELLRRLSDPHYFQAMGCALAFDWNSSGLTVTLLAALKAAFKERRLGLYIAGGKGKTSRKTPAELMQLGEQLGFEPSFYIRLSRLTAKVDNSLIQDGFTIYHHSFILSKTGDWAVVQQGMNTNLGQARRYQWYGPVIPKTDLTEEPHQGITAMSRLDRVLNLTAKESRGNKQCFLELIQQPRLLERDLKLLKQPQKSLFLENTEFTYHPVLEEKFDFKRLKQTLVKATYLQPNNLEKLLLTEGVGPRTIRALSLISELIYKQPASWIDPARYTFVHGGKDGTPYPVDRQTYDETIKFFNKALNQAKKIKC
jgi:hypothetical protein